MTYKSRPRQYTTEPLFGGHLTCRQHRHGYRFSQDPVLLAHFFTPSSPDEHILDLGAGCGIIALILAYRWPGVSVTGLELQPALVELARANVEQNGFADRLRIVAGDLKEVPQLFPAASFARVVCNPPYYQLGAARPNPNLEQAIARHEIKAGLKDIVAAVEWLLAEGGRADFVYPANRADQLQDMLKAKGCKPVRVQEVYSYPGGPCRLVLLEAVKGSNAELEIMSPLYVQMEPEGGYGPEMAGCYKPGEE